MKRGCIDWNWLYYDDVERRIYTLSHVAGVFLFNVADESKINEVYAATQAMARLYGL